MKKALIVGGGYGGLASANILARDGLDVTVIEKNKTLGGRGRVWKKEGFTFDMGPSWYLMPEVFENYFAIFGEKTSDYYRLLKLDPYYTVFFEKHEKVTVSSDIKKTEKLFSKFENGGGERLVKYLLESAYKYNSAMKDFLYKDYNTILTLLNPRLIKEGMRMGLFGSLDKFVGNFFSDIRSRQILEYAMVFLGNSPSNAPALYSIMSHVDLNLGVFYPEGGMGKITDALVKLGKSLGVKYVCEEEVKSINSYGRKITSVKTSKNEYPTDYVLANADYAHVETELLTEKDRTYGEKYWKKKTLAPSMFIAYLGINKKLKKVTHHNLYFSDEWNKHFDMIFKNKAFPDNPCFYMSCPSVTDGSAAPDGCENIFILVPIAPGLDDTIEVRELYFEKVIAHIEKVTGESIRKSIILKRIYSVSDFKSDYNALEGTALGIAHTLFQTAYFRPRRKSKKLKNLFYSGQYTHPGVGVPMTFIAAQLAAESIVRDMLK